MITIAINTDIEDGISVLVSLSILVLDILPTTNRLRPIGGVTIPKAKVTIITIPKCTGSTPTSIAIGTKIGAKIIIAAFVSINIPTKSSNNATKSRNIDGLSEIEVIVVATCCGIFSIVSIQLNSPAAPSINMIDAVVSVAEVKTVLIFLKVIPLYMSTLTKKA